MFTKGVALRLKTLGSTPLSLPSRFIKNLFENYWPRVIWEKTFQLSELELPWATSKFKSKSSDFFQSRNQCVRLSLMSLKSMKPYPMNPTPSFRQKEAKERMNDKTKSSAGWGKNNYSVGESRWGSNQRNIRQKKECEKRNYFFTSRSSMPLPWLLLFFSTITKMAFFCQFCDVKSGFRRESVPEAESANISMKKVALLTQALELFF